MFKLDCAVAAIALTIAGAQGASAGVVTRPVGIGDAGEFAKHLPGITQYREQGSLFVTQGPDGAMWDTQLQVSQSGSIGRFDPVKHTRKSWLLPAANATAWGITTGPDGALWFTEYDNNQGHIGRFDPVAQKFSFYPLPGPYQVPYAITVGSDNALWFTESDGPNTYIGRLDMSTNAITPYWLPTTFASPYGIVEGPDNAMWFTEDAGKIGRIDLSSYTVTEMPLPDAASAAPSGIALGPDGALWFAETGDYQIGRIVPGTFAISEFPIARTYKPTSIAASVDGNLWFTAVSSNNVGALGRFSLQTDTATEYTATKKLPLDVPVGISTASDGALWFSEEHNYLGKICPTKAARSCKASL
jgi:virginiamycin B lyase